MPKTRRLTEEEALKVVLERGWPAPPEKIRNTPRRLQTWIMHRLYIDAPTGVENWTDWDIGRYLTAQNRNRRRNLKKVEAIKERARRESNYTPPPVNADVTEEDEPFIVRALYGPMLGLVTSFIIGLNYDDRYLKRRVEGGIRIFEESPSYGQRKVVRNFKGDVVGSAEGDIPSDVITYTTDGLDPKFQWGPKQFLHELFTAVAYFGAKCTIYMVHSDTVIEIDPDQFYEWAQRSQEDPASAIAEPLSLVQIPRIREVNAQESAHVGEE